MTFTCQEGAAVFQQCLYLSESRLCSSFSGERQNGGERGWERQAGQGVTPHFVIAKEALKKITIPGQR